jgi:histidinol dehydrogenase
MRVKRIEWDGKEAVAMARRLRGATPALGEVAAEVTATLETVRERGDEAVRELSERFDDAVPESLRVDPEAIEAAPGLLEPPVREALRLAAANIEAVARAELATISAPTLVELEQGQRVEVRTEPVHAAGVYAPGGRAAYPSSVLMTCIPARAAGVARLAVVTPPGAGGRPSAAVLAACSIAGADEVYAVGGAQAIAALAFGTATIASVDVIAGPGNRFVTEAKRQVSGDVGIDGLAGPSELLVVADGTADPRLIALDLCAQAEHGEDSPLVVVSPDGAVLDEIAERVVKLASERTSVADSPLALVTAPGMELALFLADAYAPEHLELSFASADETVARGRVAGCVFLGPGGATAFGDYAAGSNHVLPTGRAARFGGPLSARAFMRRTSVVSMPASAAAALAPHVAAIAEAEGLPVHGESAIARGKRPK